MSHRNTRKLTLVKAEHPIDNGCERDESHSAHTPVSFGEDPFSYAPRWRALSGRASTLPSLLPLERMSLNDRVYEGNRGVRPSTAPYHLFVADAAPEKYVPTKIKTEATELDDEKHLPGNPVDIFDASKAVPENDGALSNEQRKGWSMEFPAHKKFAKVIRQYMFFKTGRQLPHCKICCSEVVPFKAITCKKGKQQWWRVRCAQRQHPCWDEACLVKMRRHGRLDEHGSVAWFHAMGNHFDLDLHKTTPFPQAKAQEAVHNRSVHVMHPASGKAEDITTPTVSETDIKGVIEPVETIDLKHDRSVSDGSSDSLRKGRSRSRRRLKS